MSIFTGSAVAIVTPFNDDKSINYDAFRKIVERQIAAGTDAILVAGTSGEATVIDDAEQIKLIKYCVDIVNKRVPVIAGAGSNITSHACELAKLSEESGADALLMVTPYYNKTTQKGLVKHYTEIANSVSTPIILYSVSGRTGLNIAPETVYELSKVKNIVAIKEASGNLSQIAKIAQMCGPDFDIYSGNDDQTLPILSLGGKGVISVLANVMPKEVHEMVTKFLSGDIAGSRKIFLDTLPLANALFIETNPIPVKTACNLMGMNAGPLVAPLYDMEPANLEKLKAELKAQNLI
ncbi:MAG: 4-hydroxy-tetrahydrodipicolinate synthase [Clostridia bacterium]|jgi:4-hydroxy-tetrahydrodipicolinate synthase|nr:4-hydroxy-tetrahydrodipicolinate synthase [Clostridia bacterium]